MPTLSELREGEKGLIQTIDGDDAVAVRLMEMGLTEGEQIEFLGAAPLGDPLEFRIRGDRLSLRRAEAKRVHISNVDK